MTKKTKLIKWGLKQSPILYTITDIATKIGVTRNVLNNWISDKYLSADNLNKIEGQIK